MNYSEGSQITLLESIAENTQFFVYSKSRTLAGTLTRPIRTKHG